MYHNGQGVPKDYQEAAKWFRLAAEQGDTEAQFNLGEMYHRGQGVPADDGEAIRWYLLAADQGSLFSKYAQYALGEMYSRVKGVKEDLIQAHMWFTLAAANSHSDATEARDKLIPRMTSTQLAEAQRLAREWTTTRK
ncbi:MAG: sel1 repeat family protein [Nitrospinae bacterium]|nr:sel1 repeat family protein [Nitrospinota bacterium]